MEELLIVLTARCGSERLKNKSIAEINGQPLISWIIQRYQQIGATLVLGTTANKEDDPLEEIANSLEIPIYRHPEPNDVVGRIDHVYREMFPESEYVFRALGDCPFYATELLEHAVKTMKRFRVDAFGWVLPPENLPVYGAREFPYSTRGWELINKFSILREHVDVFYAKNRSKFKIVYHEPPDTVYMRPPTYRLEVDYQQDVELVRQVANGVGMLAPLPKVIEFLDENPDVIKINNQCREKTGPLVSFTHAERRKWFAHMRGHPIVDWDGNVWHPPDDRAIPVFCSAGNCVVGYGHRGRLYTKEGHTLGGPDRLSCECGAGKIWHPPTQKRVH